jgi:hypothetical protein
MVILEHSSEGKEMSYEAEDSNISRVYICNLCRTSKCIRLRSVKCVIHLFVTV